MSPTKPGHGGEEAGKGHRAGGDGQGTFGCSEHGDVTGLRELAILYMHMLIIQADLLSCGSRGRRMRGGSRRLINTQGSNYEFLQHRASNEEQALRQP